jgi:2-dehydro-3-deoxyphosphogluconate aldolase/(4S)-4-hydroxy-2-oxoglutarate aldolase
VAAGGVTQQTAMDLIRAGATALGIGGELIPPEAVRRRRAEQITELARRFLKIVQEARKLVAPAKQHVALR